MSIYIGKRGLGEEKLTSLVIQVNPDKGKKKRLKEKRLVERMNTFGVLRNVSHCDNASLGIKQQGIQLPHPLRALSLFLDMKEWG